MGGRGSGARRRGAACRLSLLALGFACRKTAGPRPNLLLITLDTTRADRIGCYGDGRAATPNLDRLARQGVRCRLAYTPAPLTLPAHTTLLTGLEPQGHQVRNNGTYALRPEATTLAEVLRRAGYSTAAMIAAFVLERKFGLDQGFDLYDDGLDKPPGKTTFRSEIRGDRVLEKFLRWLDGAPPPPFFCWVHLYDPHAPYDPPAPYSERFAGDPYRGEIAFSDEIVGRLLNELERRGLAQDTLVVAAGDHGEGFSEHGESGHGIFCYEESLRVPLIFHGPRILRGGRVLQGPVGLVDVMPTLLELFDLDAVAGMQGRSFAAGLRGGKNGAASSPLYFESLYGMEEMGWAPLSGILSGRLKYISLPRPELYDLEADPNEKDNVYLKRNAQAKALARELDDILARTVRNEEAARPQQSRSDQERLRALGYLASGASSSSSSNEDPKEGIVPMNRLLKVREAIQAKNLQGAEEEMAALRQTGLDRRLPQFFDTLYELALARQDGAAIRAALLEALSRFPEQTRFAILLATFHRNRGEEKQAEDTALQILAQAPETREAHLLLGEIYRGRKLTDKAIEHFQRAWDLEPEDQTLPLALADLQLEANRPVQALAALRRLLGGAAKGRELDGAVKGQAAKLLIKLGEPALAEELLRGLVNEQGGDPGPWTQLGLAQLERGQEEEARRSFEQALRLDPRQALALSGLGTLHLTLFRRDRDPRALEQAGDHFEKALAVDGRLVTALNGLGVVRLYQGDAPEAVKRLRAAVAAEPAFTNAYFNLAIAQLRLGRKAAAANTLAMLRQRHGERLSAAEHRQYEALRREANQ